MRILFVDDANTCLLFREHFVPRNHEVTIAFSAGEALRLVAENQYDTIVLEMAMPDLDGYSLACRIRRLLAFKPRPRIIAVSVSGFDASHPFAVEAGFDAYIPKPARPEVIEAALRSDYAHASQRPAALYPSSPKIDANDG